MFDSNLDIDFFRPAPDSPRLLFGGATANGLEDPAAIAALLHARLARALPDLARAKAEQTGLPAEAYDTFTKRLREQLTPAYEIEFASTKTPLP